MEDAMTDIGNLIRELRFRKRISQTELADMTRLSRPHLSRIEKGSIAPSLDTLARIAKPLGVTLSKFFNGDGNGNGRHGRRVKLKPDEKKLLRSVQQFANRIDRGDRKETLRQVKRMIVGG